MSTFRKLAHLEEQLGPKRFAWLVDSAHTGQVSDFIDQQIAAAESALWFVATVALALFDETFQALERFVVNTTDEAVVKISYVSDNFNAWFGAMSVSPQTAATLSYYTLQHDASDREIIAAFGGDKRALAVTIADIWSLMLRQPKGEEGVLLTNGRANVFYIWDDGASALRAVYVRWYGIGWRVSADELDYDDGYRGRRVFSRVAALSLAVPV